MTTRLKDPKEASAREVIDRLRRNLARYPELAGLRRALARHLEELQ